MFLLIAMGAAKNPEPGISVSKTVHLIADFGLRFYAIPAFIIARSSSATEGIELAPHPETNQARARELVKEWEVLKPTASRLFDSCEGEIESLQQSLRLYGDEGAEESARNMPEHEWLLIKICKHLEGERSTQEQNLHNLAKNTFQFIEKIRQQKK